jgi:uncharacterized membrane protein YeiH
MSVKPFLAAAAAVLVAAAPAAPAGGLARVWIADEQPLVVRGSGFHDAANVTVLVAKLKQSYRMTTISSTTGAFTARFHSALSTRCGTTVVTATDENGRRAISRIVANDCGGIRIPPTGP